MANFIEKRLPKKVRDNMQTFIPDTNGNVFLEGLILLGVTTAVVYASIGLEKALDGK